MIWWSLYALAWTGAAALSLVFTLVCRRAAPCLGFLDMPLGEAHKQHRTPTPVLGGVAMFLAWVLTIAAGLAVATFGRAWLPGSVATLLPGVAAVGGRLGVIVAAALALVLLGMADDRCRLGAGTKLLGQVVVAAAVAAWGVRITFFCPIPLVTWTVTAFWLLLIINAINFLDNMDGLAAGTGAIAALLFAFVAGLREQHFVALLSAVTCGSACGFLVFNRPPASIFMGDAGSHLLGFLLAVIGALTTFYAPGETLAGPMSQTHAPVLIPLLVLAIPIFDLAAVVFIRARQHRPVYVGDHQHISHRFEGMGLSRPQSVLQVHLLGLAIGAGAVLLLWLPLTGVLVVLLQAAAMITLVTLLHTRRFGGRTPVAPPAPAATSDRLEERADSARSVPP